MRCKHAVVATQPPPLTESPCQAPTKLSSVPKSQGGSSSGCAAAAAVTLPLLPSPEPPLPLLAPLPLLLVLLPPSTPAADARSLLPGGGALASDPSVWVGSLAAAAASAASPVERSALVTLPPVPLPCLALGLGFLLAAPAALWVAVWAPSSSSSASRR